MTKDYVNIKLFRQVLKEYKYRYSEWFSFLNGDDSLVFPDKESEKEYGNRLWEKKASAQKEVEKYALRLLLRHKGKNDALCARIMRMLKQDCWFVWLGISKNCM